MLAPAGRSRREGLRDFEHFENLCVSGDRAALRAPGSPGCAEALLTYARDGVAQDALYAFAARR
jgi:hypothetical protein